MGVHAVAGLDDDVALRTVNHLVSDLLAANGRQAVEACRSKQYDLILMDIQMPVMGGFDATKEIRKIEKSLATAHASSKGDDGNIHPQITDVRRDWAPVPIIAMTAHSV